MIDFPSFRKSQRISWIRATCGGLYDRPGPEAHFEDIETTNKKNNTNI